MAENDIPAGSVVVTTKEIYDTLLEVREKVTVMSQTVDGINKDQSATIARRSDCDSKFRQYDSMAGQVKALWFFVTGIIMALIGVAIDTFSHGGISQ